MHFFAIFEISGSWEAILRHFSDFFPVRAEAQGSLCVFRPLGLLPGVCSRRVGGFFCRKNAAFLSRTLKNCGVLPLGLVAVGAWASRFYAYLRCFRSLCLVRATS